MDDTWGYEATQLTLDGVEQEKLPPARRKNDAYYTPFELAMACVGTVGGLSPRRIIEPSVGGGAFARACRKTWPNAVMLGFDVEREASGRLDLDYFWSTDWTGPHGICADLVIGNPPYNQAEAHVRKALECAPVVAFLLRLGFLAGQKRAAFWRDHPPDSVHVLSKRPSFTGGSTDATEYGWFTWDQRHNHDSPPVIEWLDWGKK